MVLRWVPFGAKTSRYGSHDLGYRRAAKILQSDAILYPGRLLRSAAHWIKGAPALRARQPFIIQLKI
jgi:hypothetical protein